VQVQAVGVVAEEGDASLQASRARRGRDGRYGRRGNGGGAWCWGSEHGNGSAAESELETGGLLARLGT
jgi:hypothetical protein